MIKEEIEQFCKKNKIIYIERIERDNFNRNVYGDINDLPYKGLYMNLLEDNIKINSLIKTIENDNELHTWRQGNLIALVFLCPKLLVCLFGISEKKGLESLEYSQKVFQEYVNMMNGVSE